MQRWGYVSAIAVSMGRARRSRPRSHGANRGRPARGTTLPGDAHSPLRGKCQWGAMAFSVYSMFDVRRWMRSNRSFRGRLHRALVNE